MALAEGLHRSSGPSTKKVVERRESSEEMEVETHSDLRAQKTSSPGTRPAPLSELAGPHGAAVTVGYVTAGALLLAVGVPALRGDDGVDATSLHYLLWQSLARKKKEEEEEEEGSAGGEAVGAALCGGRQTCSSAFLRRRLPLRHPPRKRDADEVPVTMLHKFLQFFEFLLQFIDRVLDIPAWHRDRHWVRIMVLVALWVRIMVLVALASLVVILVVPPRSTVTCFRLLMTLCP